LSKVGIHKPTFDRRTDSTIINPCLKDRDLSREKDHAKTLYFQSRYVKISQSPKCTQQEHSRNSNQNRHIPQKQTDTQQHIISIGQ
jgi:hypothetical protein